MTRAGTAIGLVLLCLATVGGVTWAVTDALSLQKTYGQAAANSAHAYANETGKSIKRRCFPLPPEKKQDCIEEARHAARQNEREERNLEAQRITSTWTAYMGGAALIGMAISIIGVGLVFITFRETRKATAAAQHSAASALASLHANRAWLTFSGQNTYHIASGEIDGVPVGQTVAVAIKWKNTGNSPALNATCSSRFVVVDLNAPIPHFDAGEQGDPISASIGAGGEVTGVPMALSNEQFQRLTNRTAKWYCFSRVDYREVYHPDIVRISEACFDMEYLGPRSDAPGGPSYHHFNGSVVGPQNSVS